MFEVTGCLLTRSSLTTRRLKVSTYLPSSHDEVKTGPASEKSMLCGLYCSRPLRYLNAYLFATRERREANLPCVQAVVYSLTWRAVSGGSVVGTSFAQCDWCGKFKTRASRTLIRHR